MSIKKKLLVIVLCLMILATVMVGILWHRQHYQMVDFRFYPKNAVYLDLRDQEITVSHYSKLRRRLPDCRIDWNVPLQDASYPQDTRELTLPGLTRTDAEMLAYFPQLEKLDARGCEDYQLLQMVKKTYPQLQVLYTVTVSGNAYPQDARQLTVDGITSQEVERIQYLPELTLVRLESGKDPAQLVALTTLCKQRGIALQVVLGGVAYDTETQALEAERVTAEELQLMYFLPGLRTVTLTDPQADPQSLLHFAADHPSMDISWTKEVLGVSCSSAATRLDLTAGISQEGAAAYERAKTLSIEGERDETVYMFPVSDKYPLPDMTGETDRILAETAQALAYFPNLEEVLLCGAILDNEAMAAFRNQNRDQFKVVWNVQCGNKMIVRTDATYFMPTKYHVYYFLDSDSENLKYCEDMVCVDLGHMAISNIEWVKYMPRLTYLVLAHTQLQYIEPIRGCQNLKFLELDWSPIKDYAPLEDCKSLEDLNLGNTYADFEPIGRMTWLKHLWMIGCSRGAAYRMTEALTDTQVMVSGSATVANGWRELPNYYAMRDEMGMYYMEW